MLFEFDSSDIFLAFGLIGIAFSFSSIWQQKKKKKIIKKIHSHSHSHKYKRITMCNVGKIIDKVPMTLNKWYWRYSRDEINALANEIEIERWRRKQNPKKKKNCFLVSLHMRCCLYKCSCCCCFRCMIFFSFIRTKNVCILILFVYSRFGWFFFFGLWLLMFDGGVDDDGVKSRNIYMYWNLLSI